METLPEEIVAMVLKMVKNSDRGAAARHEGNEYQGRVGHLACVSTWF